MGGTQTAGILSGGIKAPANTNSAENEYYNGSSWSEQTDLNEGRYGMGGAGTQTAMLVFGVVSFGASPVFTNKVELWNGSGWTETAEMNTARHYIGSCGTSTAALGSGSTNGHTETWNGSAWTEVADMNSVRSTMKNAGSYTDCISFGGYFEPTTSYVGFTELWDGTSWTEINDMSTGRGEMAAAKAGTSGSTLAAGGSPGAPTANEEFTRPATSTVTFTAS